MSTDAKVIGGIIGVTLVIFTGLIALSSRTPSLQQEITTVAPENMDKLVREDSQKITSSTASVTLVEFTDFECEACRAAYPIVKKILSEYEGKITFVLRNFPLHGNSVLAAKSAEAAGEQGKFWEMNNLLFENQTAWGEKQTPQTELFTQYAQTLGLDMEKFSASLSSDAYKEKINRDKNDGIALGVKGTPTFFLNGKIISGVPSYEKLKEKIEGELKSVTP